MKGLIIACLLALAVPLMAEDRYEVSVKIYRKQADSLLVAKQDSIVRALDPRMGEINISNDEFIIIAFRTADTTALIGKFVKVLRKVSPAGTSTAKITPFKKLEVEVSR